MKKILLLALLIAMGATLNTTEAKKKKDKKQKAIPVVLQNAEDSVCYVIGLANGGQVKSYMMQQGIDTTYIDDFIRGYAEGTKAGNSSSEDAYFAGIQMGAQMTRGINKSVFLDDPNNQVSTNHLIAGMIDGINGNKNVMDIDQMGPQIDGMVERVHNKAMERKYGKNKEEGAHFLAENAKQPDVVILPSGLQYKVLRQGSGAVASTNDEVEVKYEGRLIDGTVFDSSYTRDPQTTTFTTSQVIKGWTEALTLMPEGSMWELYIPYDLAYGERDMGKIPPFSTLIFKVELEKVKKKKIED